MVIKILKNSTSFNGIQYSDSKKEKGEGSLLAAENFPFENMAANDYNDYLEAQSDLNKKVKNKQFHVSISTKGNQHSFEELAQVAKDYLEYMGYKDNPYLIYAHRDSPNNHVHIVTSRVDENGKKIPDSLEKARTQKFIKNELNINFSSTVNESIKEAFKFKFRDVSSLQSLLSKDGYKSRMTKKELELIKSGEVQSSIPRRKIKDHIYFSKFDYKEKNKIKAQIYRYSSGTDFMKLKSSLRKNFGIEIIYTYDRKDLDLNQVRNSASVVDYHLIDHNSKTVYTSKDLLSIDELKRQFSSILSKEEIAQIVYEVKTNPTPINELRGFFNEHNLKLKYNGDITLPSGELVAKLDNEILERLKYKQRQLDIKKLNYSTHISQHILSKIYKVSIRDIELNPNPLSPEDKLLYREMVTSQLERNRDNISNEGDFKIYNTNDGAILLDHENKRILHLSDDLDINTNREKQIPLLKNDTPPVLEYSSTDKVLVSDIYTEDLDTGDQKRKKRRKRQMNINQ